VATDGRNRTKSAATDGVKTPSAGTTASSVDAAATPVAPAQPPAGAAAAPVPLDVTNIPEALGFTAESRQGTKVWRLPVAAPQGDDAERPSKASSRLRNPWRVEGCELVERKGRISVHTLNVTLDRQALIFNLKALARKHFGPRTRLEVVPAGDGGWWCLAEFVRPGSREAGSDGAPSPTQPATAGAPSTPSAPSAPYSQGTGGFRWRLLPDGALVTAIVTDHFGIGWLPTNFPPAPLRILAEALWFRAGPPALAAAAKIVSVHEVKAPAVLPALVHAAAVSGASAAATQALLDALTQSRVQPTVAGRTTATADSFVAPPDGPEHATVGFVPVEALESRELAARQPEIDELIGAGKYARALKIAVAAHAKAPDDLYLLRRLALLALAGRCQRSVDFLGRALAREATSKLFLACAVNRSLEDGDRRATLTFLSRLGAALAADISGMESLSAFDVVLPELLGDAWQDEDPRKAEECYRRVLERRGDTPRVLRKLIDLARRGGRPSAEVDWLVRLGAVERRRSELARIHHRLAELKRQSGYGPDAVLPLALKAVGHDRGNDRAALLAAYSLASLGRSQEAINLLDSLLKDPAVSLAPVARARLEARIAGLWLDPLGRRDLAEARFEQAVTHDPGNIEALRGLEALYRERGDERRLATILEAQFDACEEASDGEALRRVFDELASLYRGTLAQPRRAWDLYQRLVASAAASSAEIDRALGWNDAGVDWRELYGKLLSRLATMPAGEKRAHFLGRLAEICREKLDDADAATRHLLAALDDGWVDPAAFRFLTERMAAKGDMRALAKAFEVRSSQVSGPEQRQLLLELLAIPGAVDAPRRDELAIRAWLVDPAINAPVVQRFRAYQEAEDVDGVARLVQLLDREPRLSALQRAGWLRVATETLEGFSDPRRFAVMDAAFKRLIELSEDPVAAISGAIVSLKGAPSAQMLAPYVARLVASGVAPALDERTVTRLLAGQEQNLAAYHLLLAFKAVDVATAAQHARTAAAIYAKIDGSDVQLEKALSRLAALAPCAEDDLAQLASLVERSGNWPTLARALQQQANFEDEAQRKASLLERLGEIYWRRMRDYARSRLAYMAAMPLVPRPSRLRGLLADLARDAGEKTHERALLLELAGSAEADESAELAVSRLERLLALGEDATLVARTYGPRLEAALATGRYAAAGAIGSALARRGLASLEQLHSTFNALAAAGDEPSTEDIWWRGLLAGAGSRTKARAWLAETTSILQKADRIDFLGSCLKSAYERDASELGPKARQELVMAYGTFLFDHDAKRHKALPVFQEGAAADPEDVRAWMPLYFLMAEFGRPEERMAHLHALVPRLERDARPLKALPVTIESLKAELRELETQLEGVTQARSPRPTLSIVKDPPAPAPAPGPAALDEVTTASAVTPPPPPARADTKNWDGGKGETVAAKPVARPMSLEESVPEPGVAEVAAAAEGLSISVPVYRPAPVPQAPDPAVAELGLDAVGGGAPGLDVPASDWLVSESPGRPSEGECGAVGLDLGAPDGDMPARVDRETVVGATEIFSPGASAESAMLDIGLGEVQRQQWPGAEQGGAAMQLDPMPLPTPDETPALSLDGLDAGGAPEAASLDLLGEAPAEDSSASLALEVGDVAMPALPSLDESPVLPPLPPPGAPAPRIGDGFVLGGSEGGADEDGSDDVGALGILPPTPPAPPLAPVLPPQDPVAAPGGDEDEFALAVIPGDGDGEMPAPPVISPPPAASGAPASVTPPPPNHSGAQFGAGTHMGEATAMREMDVGQQTDPRIRVVRQVMAPPKPRVAAANESAPNPVGTGSGQSSVHSRQHSQFGTDSDGEGDGGSLDWRAAIRAGDVPRAAVAQVLSQAFASETEKHLAVQGVALVAGRVDALADWHWRVWRHPEEYGYPLSAKERFPETGMPGALQQPLYKLVAASIPVLARVFRERFAIDHVAKRLNTQPAMVAKIRKRAHWNDGILAQAGFGLYQERITQRRYHAYTVPGLGREIVYDAANREFYFDEGHFRKLPTSHLFHRLLFQLWSVRLQTFVPLGLHPQKQFMPFMTELHRILSATGLSKLTNKLSQRSELGKVLAAIDVGPIAAAHEKVGMPSDDQVVQLWMAMKEYVYRLALAETLDLVGLFEMILEKDLAQPDALAPGELAKASPYARSLLDFAAKLKV
jgi:tetratricopeptide (TPR) repeat protein